MKELNAEGCLDFVGAAVMKCFTLPKKKEKHRAIEARLAMVKNEKVLQLWSYLVGVDYERLSNAISKFNNRVLEGKSVPTGQGLEFYLDKYGV